VQGRLGSILLDFEQANKPPRVSAATTDGEGQAQ
jgi:hypothetical protein